MSAFREAARRAVLALLHGYKVAISPHLGENCRFYPSCSQYAKEAVTKHGVRRGLVLGLARLIRCGPWHPGGVDPVP